MAKRKKSSQAAVDKKKCDELFSRLVRSRARRCEAAGIIEGECKAHGPSRWQCAHIIHRQYSMTRVLDGNAWCLCAGHHFRVDTNPDLWAVLVQATVGLERVQEMRRLANGPLLLDGFPASAAAFWAAHRARLEQACHDEGVPMIGEL
jgi:hypothetical protein